MDNGVIKEEIAKSIGVSTYHLIAKSTGNFNSGLRKACMAYQIWERKLKKTTKITWTTYGKKTLPPNKRILTIIRSCNRVFAKKVINSI